MVEMGQKHSKKFFKNAKKNLQIKIKWLKIFKNGLKIVCFFHKKDKAEMGVQHTKISHKMDKK